jgi:anti-sigma factor RsiW
MKLIPRQMTCAEMVALLTDYLEGSLIWRQRLRFERHLRVCPDCVRYVAQMRQVIASAGELPEEEIPPAVLDDLLVAFRDWHAG